MKKDFKNNQIIEIALADFEKTNIMAITVLDEVIVRSFENIFTAVDSKAELFKLNNEMINGKIMENHFNFDTEFIDITNYIEDEIIEFETKLFPLNYYKMECFRFHSNSKTRIINAVWDKLSEVNSSKINQENGSKFINNWDNSILIFSIKKDGQTSDFDNYFMKPFVDGIKKSGFIKDDSFEYLSISYTKSNSNNQLVKATLINKKHFNKYGNYILELLQK